MSETDDPAAAGGREAVGTLANPTPARASEFVADAFERGDVVSVFGTCTVEYEGRASSHLGPGDRLVICKPDGTTLVHTDEGHQPVNWQPPGSSQQARVTEGRLELYSERSTPAEELLVSFDAVLQVTAYDVTDERDLALVGTESDLKAQILDDPDVLEPGFTPLSTERPTPAGAVDIFGEDADGRRVVVELKRRRVGPDAVGQLTRYVDALQRDLHADAEVRGILVAPSVTDRARQLLAEQGMEFVALEPDGDAPAAAGGEAESDG
ncbi:MAG: endonuclease NucS [Haloarculaceae archaeon]